jgi:hypothetical protein
MDRHHWRIAMSWVIGGNRRPERSPHPTDAFFESYVGWREACAAAGAAYERGRDSETAGRGLAFAAFLAALDGEEHAASMHSKWTARVPVVAQA